MFLLLKRAQGAAGLRTDAAIERAGGNAQSRERELGLKHVLDGARRHSVALVNSVELYWLCCALLRGDVVDKNAVREAILGSNGYVDLRPFCGGPPFTP